MADLGISFRGGARRPIAEEAVLVLAGNHKESNNVEV
jgi:hypothetical protein